MSSSFLSYFYTVKCRIPARFYYCNFVAIRCYTAIMERELEAIFRHENLRLTTPRREIFTTLRNSKTPLSASMIARDCHAIDRVSIYRTIQLFLRLGIVESVPLGWKQRYELTGPFKSHHHHLTCVQCAKLIDVQSPQFERVVAEIANSHEFTAYDHTFEIRGYCKNCR